uniref:Mitochondrial import inner membrane translocase subunit Tim13 n=1 Tax=Anthurium amnicola TaxID=1678845 RepID=A0A1D1YBY4_9ARAE
MDPFTSSPSSSGSLSSSGPSTEVLMDQLKVQLAQAYAEEFLEVILFPPSAWSNLHVPVFRRIGSPLWATCKAWPLFSVYLSVCIAGKKFFCFVDAMFEPCLCLETAD